MGGPERGPSHALLWPTLIWPGSCFGFWYSGYPWMQILSLFNIWAKLGLNDRKCDAKPDLGRMSSASVRVFTGQAGLVWAEAFQAQASHLVNRAGQSKARPGLLLLFHIFLSFFWANSYFAKGTICSSWAGPHLGYPPLSLRLPIC